MQKEEKKWFRLLIFSFSFFIVCLILVARWNVSLIGEVKKSEVEREELKRYIERLEILEKVEGNFIKDVLRQKSVALCFWELIGEFGEKYTSKEKQDCIQLIVMADEQYGHKGLNAPLILAWLEGESKGNPEAVSYAGAKGLTQLMDYRAWKILIAMGYPAYDRELVFNPVVSLAGGLYYLKNLMNFWEWKGVKDQNHLLSYTLHSYKWGTESTEELYNTDKKADGPSSKYVNKIFKRREHWTKKLKYWIDDAQKLAEKFEEKKMS